jgi:thymidylate synthase (FAD)
MRLIKPSYEIIEQGAGLDGIYKQIELAGRTCYKSTDKIIEDSAKGFVERMVKSGHGAMLEHGTVYLHIQIPRKVWHDGVSNYYHNPHTVVNSITDALDTHYYITTNYRVMVENGWLGDLKYICEPTEYHEKRVTVRFVCDRGVSHKKFVA